MHNYLLINNTENEMKNKKVISHVYDVIKSNRAFHKLVINLVVCF